MAYKPLSKPMMTKLIYANIHIEKNEKCSIRFQRNLRKGHEQNYTDDLVQDCSNSIADALELPVLC